MPRPIELMEEIMVVVGKYKRNEITSATAITMIQKLLKPPTEEEETMLKFYEEEPEAETTW